MALPGGSEISAALRGLALLLRGDRRALFCYDLSVDGFWRSFLPPLIVAGVYFLLQDPAAAELQGWEDNRIGYSLVQAGQYLSAWIAYLAAVILLCRAFQLTAGYAAFVTLYNWAQAIVTAATLPVLLADQAGWLPAGTLAGWHFTLLFVWLYIIGQIARVSLGATLPVAIMAASLDLAVTILLHRLVSVMLA